MSICVLASFEEIPSTFFVIEHPNLSERNKYACMLTYTLAMHVYNLTTLHACIFV